MKQNRRLTCTTLAFSLVLGFALAGAAAARAAECPAHSPERTEERRSLAKEWFARAEQAENQGNDLDAVRAYACSMKMVAHAYTAYNLARVAERSGDLELALRSYRAYLTLKADARDKEEVQGRIKGLEDKIAAVKEGAAAEAAAAAAAVENPAKETPPPAAEPAPAPAPAEPSPPTVTERPDEPPSSNPHITEWVIAGVGVAALAAGIFFNVKARGKMDDCNSLANQGKLASANSACDSARPYAYTSYAMFGAAGLAALIDGVLLIRGPSSDVVSTAMSLGWAPGMPLTLTARGRF
jgi:hypothetical protein